MATICQKIDKAFSLARRPLSIRELTLITEVEVVDLFPVLMSMLDGMLLRVDEEGRYYRPVLRAEGF